MGKYTEDAKELLQLVGGKENIAAVSHCMTRMRFVLGDPAKADVKGIEAMKVVKGSFTQAGQFQVIIGNDVASFYNDFTAVAGIEGVSKDAVKAAAKSNQNALQRAVAVIAEIFAPIIPAIIVGGLILGFRNCIDALYLFENGTKTLVEISPFWAGMDKFLWLIGEAVFHMLPVGICWSVTKKMGTTQMLGIVLGLTLVSGQLLNAYAVATTPVENIPVWDFGSFTVQMIGYQAQVLPAILAAFTLVYLEKFFRRITPQVVSMIVVPFCSLLLSVIAAHFVLGPIGWKIGSAVSSVVFSGITGSFQAVFAAIFGFIYAPLVITGLHHMTNAIGVGGIPGILSIQPQYMPTFALSMLVAICVPFVLTTIVGKRRGIDKVTDAVVEAETKEALAPAVAADAEPVKELTAYVDGEVVTLASLNDGVFSAGMVGDGFAIRPAGEVVVSPAGGTVTVLMEESRHAIGLTLDDGTELLIHVGLDTVAMGGDGFTYLVQQGDHVSKGEPLLRFDRDKIKKAGHPDTVICVVTNPGDLAAFAFPTGGRVEAGKSTVAHRAAAIEAPAAQVAEV